MMFPMARTVGFFGFWAILAGLDIADVMVGIPASVMAAWVSLRLLPPGQWRLRPFALAQLLLRFLRQSVAAGIDVAWRALDPRLPLRPGFVAYQPQLPQGAGAKCVLHHDEPAAGHAPVRLRRKRRSRHPLPRRQPAGDGATG